MGKRIDEVIDEVRLLWNTLVYRGEQLHRGAGITMSMRAVLEFLSRNGPTSVPNIARARRVSRQHIQGLVNALEELDLVTASENPAHSRSPLIRSTRAGERLIARMRRREERLLERAVHVPDSDLRRTADVLRAIRVALEA